MTRRRRPATRRWYEPRPTREAREELQEALDAVPVVELPEEQGGHRLWQGETSNGYPVVRAAGQDWYARRALWRLRHWRIPERLRLWARRGCPRLCVHLDHLELRPGGRR